MRAWMIAAASLALAPTAFVACGGASGPEPEHLAVWEAGTPAWPIGDDDAGDAGAPSLCENGVPSIYPGGGAVAVGSALPDLRMDGLDVGGAPTTLAMHDWFEPCAKASRLVVLRVVAGWCGTCRWAAAHTGELTHLDVGARVNVIDVLVADEDNAPPTIDAAKRWRARQDVSARVAIDPTMALLAANVSRAPLPLYLFVDTRTMNVRSTMADPDPDALALRVRQEIASLDGAPPPMATMPPKKDGRFGRAQWDLIVAMGATPGAPPPDPTNAKGDDAAAAALGKQLYADATLSPSKTVSCATCHDPTKSFADGLPQSVGVARGDRNAPSVALAAHARWQFWDGRADSLWAQALGPLENPKEVASTRLFVAHAIFDRYAAAYQAVFGALPPLGDAQRFPASGKPGDASWSAMAAADQQAATRVFANVGKAIAAYERTLRVKPNALDAYAGGDLGALQTAQKDGLRAFFVAGCAQCHYGPRLTDDAFHDVRFPTGRQDGQADRGRIDGVPLLLASEFSATGAFSDESASGAPLAITQAGAMLGAFKTPALRGVATTAPYGHGGTLATLADVVKTYSTSGLADGDPRAIAPAELWVPKFDDATRDAIPAFLEVLTAEAAPSTP